MPSNTTLLALLAAGAVGGAGYYWFVMREDEDDLEEAAAPEFAPSSLSPEGKAIPFPSMRPPPVDISRIQSQIKEAGFIKPVVPPTAPTDPRLTETNVVAEVSGTTATAPSGPTSPNDAPAYMEEPIATPEFHLATPTISTRTVSATRNGSGLLVGLGVLGLGLGLAYLTDPYRE